MKVKLRVAPLSSYRPPQYPMKEQVLAHPEMLEPVPARWKGIPALCAALALTVSAGLCGCAQSDRARFFARGDGEVIGAGDWAGMIQVPAFLSEQEAARIVREEAQAWGLHLEGEGEMVITGDFPLPAVAYTADYGDTRKTWQGQLQLDGYDEKKKVAFEYVSKEDIDQWAQQAVDGNARVEMYRFYQTAYRLTESMQAQLRDSGAYMGVFYDPGTTRIAQNDDTWDEKAYQQAQKEYKIEQLRLQVRDFLDWLAAEGII